MDDWLTVSARTHPERAAVVAGGRETSYAELDEAASRTARRLAALGVGMGDRVATTLPAGPAFAELLHALPRLGAVLVPLNTRLTARERDAQLAEAGARLVVEEPPTGEEADVSVARSRHPDREHTLLFTSGTSGAPKPVVLTHGNHHASARASAENLGVESGDRWLCVLPVFHVGGLSILIRSAIYGTTAVLHERFDPAEAVVALEDGEVTLVSLVATMLARLREAGLERAPRLRAALLGGGPIPGELLRWSHERSLPVVPTYGMTETASQIATLPPAEATAEPVARPLPGVEVRIEEGEILVRGAMVSAAALAADGWLHTGDRGSLTPDGLLRVEGRLDDTIVTGGENVSAREVEDVLLEHPAVREAAVVGRPDAEWGEVVTAYVVGKGITEGELVEHCRTRLAGYKVPKTIHFAEELPRNAAGKVQKHRLAP